MNALHISTTSLLLFLVAGFSTAFAEDGDATTNATKNATGRSGRNDYEVYSPSDTYVPQQSDNFFSADDVIRREDKSPSEFEFRPDTRLSKDNSKTSKLESIYSPPSFEEYVPPRFHKPRNPSKPRYYTPSETSVNWNVWKGEQVDTAVPSAGNKGSPTPDFGDYYFPADTWKGDPWTPDHMSTMMYMMNQAHKPKFGGFLSRLAQDPAMLLVAIILPFSILLAAVLPTLVNMMMNGGLPTITTTASGNNGRNLDGAEFLKPVIQTITTLGARSFDDPECMQKIFCQVTRGTPNGTESRSFQKALYSASRLIDSYWLESFGVKTLFDSMKDGDCNKIPCKTHSPSPRHEEKSKET